MLIRISKAKVLTWYWFAQPYILFNYKLFYWVNSGFLHLKYERMACGGLHFIPGILHCVLFLNIFSEINVLYHARCFNSQISRKFPAYWWTWVSIVRITNVMSTSLGRFKFNKLKCNENKTQKLCQKTPPWCERTFTLAATWYREATLHWQGIPIYQLKSPASIN